MFIFTEHKFIHIDYEHLMLSPKSGMQMPNRTLRAITFLDSWWIIWPISIICWSFLEPGPCFQCVDKLSVPSFSPGTFSTLFPKKDFIYWLLEREAGSERGRETSTCGCLSCAPYWGPGPQLQHVYNWELNWRPIGSQAHAQSTELYQLGISTLKRQKYYPTLRLSTSYTLGALLWLIVWMHPLSPSLHSHNTSSGSKETILSFSQFRYCYKPDSCFHHGVAVYYNLNP